MSALFYYSFMFGWIFVVLGVSTLQQLGVIRFPWEYRAVGFHRRWILSVAAIVMSPILFPLVGLLAIAAGFGGLFVPHYWEVRKIDLADWFTRTLAK